MSDTATWQSLARELARVRRSLRVRMAADGVLGVAAIGLGAALATFALDRAFTPPPAVRLVLAAAGLALLAWTSWVTLIKPLRLELKPTEVALALERYFPELAQRLVSAVQLGASPPRPGEDPVLVGRLLQGAEGRLRTLPVRQVFDRQRLLLRGAGAGFLGALAVSSGLLWPGDVAAWGQRMLGLAVRYPRQTLLQVVLPPSGPTLKVEDDTVLLARGADLPVAVRVAGIVPEAIWLVTGDGTEHPTSPKEPRLFRHTFRAVPVPFAFHAKGGDDPEGDRRITVRILEAPAVGAIVAEVTPPAYTGGAVSRQEGGPVEALAGSQVRLRVHSTQEVLEGHLAFESGLEVPLARTAEGALEAAFPLDRPDRYRVHLLGRNGLGNVRPGSHPVLVLRDGAPRITLAAPSGSELPLTLKGTLPLRATLADDFGLVRAVLRAELADGTPPVEKVLFAAPGVRKQTLVTLLPLAELFPPARLPREGDTLRLSLQATDNAEPQPNTAATSQDFRLNLVSPGELQRALGDQVRRQRPEVEGAVKATLRLRQSLAEAREMAAGNRRAALQAILGGHSRLESVARRLAREMAQAFDLYVFGGGLEPTEYAPLQARYRSWFEAQPEQIPFDPAFYLQLWSDRQGGGLALSLRPARVLDMIQVGVKLEQEVFREVGAQLTRALATTDPDQAGQAWSLAAARQEEALRLLRQLQTWLEEWSQFDDVVQAIRDLRDAQRLLLERTRAILRGGR